MAKRNPCTQSEYKHEACPTCGQSLTYLVTISQGTVDIVKAIATAIRNKGINDVHPRDEMEVNKKEIPWDVMIREGCLTSNHVGNLSQARFHGLIAAMDGKSGHYCLTHKGAQFLRGEFINRVAVISKKEKKQIGYLEGDIVSVKEFKHDGEYWELGYYISRNNTFEMEPVVQPTLFSLQRSFAVN